jgi:hypothetical protein
MMAPTIHMNGTGRQRLLSDAIAAGDAVLAAIERLAAAAPNARDYYPLGPTAYRTAAAEHDGRVERLRSVYRELAELAEAIANG